MRVNFLSQEVSGRTGGLASDREFLYALKDRFGDSVNVITDDAFGRDFSWLSPNFLRYGLLYRAHASEILDCDWLLTNSRLYTRYAMFPWPAAGEPKLLLTHHHFNYMTHSGLPRSVHRRIELGLLRRADIIVTPDPYTIDELAAHGFTDNVMLTEHAFAKTQYPHIETDEEFALFLGTVEPRKGLHYGIAAFAEFASSHPRWKLLIAGSYQPDGAYAKELAEQISRLGLEGSVKFLGRVSDEERSELFSTAKLFLFPSQNEGYGWVMVEAMAYGLPVVAFDNTAMPYTVNETNGALVSNCDASAMAEAMSRAVADAATWSLLSEGARRTVDSLPSKADCQAQLNAVFDLIERG